MDKRLVIRFDGPPSHESGRFIEVELDGAGVSYGEWEQDGEDWLLVLPDADAKFAELEADLKRHEDKIRYLPDSYLGKIFFQGVECGKEQLDAEIKILKDLDVSGIKIVATELAKTEPPYRWSSMWRDCGVRQSNIGKQLLRLCTELGGE